MSIQHKKEQEKDEKKKLPTERCSLITTKPRLIGRTRLVLT